MNLRRMSHQDINFILDLDRKITKGRSIITREDLITMNPGGTLDCSFVCESEGKLIGFILAQISYLGLLSGETCLIHGVGVDPAYQQHGIGSQLVHQLYSHCKTESIHTIRALAINRDTRFINFIEKMGFNRSAITVFDRNLES